MVTFFLSPDDQGSPMPQLCCNAAAAQQRATSVFPAPAWQGTSPFLTETWRPFLKAMLWKLFASDPQ